MSDAECARLRQQSAAAKLQIVQMQQLRKRCSHFASSAPPGGFHAGLQISPCQPRVTFTMGSPTNGDPPLVFPGRRFHNLYVITEDGLIRKSKCYSLCTNSAKPALTPDLSPRSVNEVQSFKFSIRRGKLFSNHKVACVFSFVSPSKQRAPPDTPARPASTIACCVAEAGETARLKPCAPLRTSLWCFIPQTSQRTRSWRY